MHFCIQAFSLPKAGNSQDEYEDAFWPQNPTTLKNVPAFRCAVADGATETSFSGLWAQMLVRAYCRGELNGKRLSQSLPRLQREWLKSVSGKPLPWYAEEKLRSGAFSSIVGLTLKSISSETKGIVAWEAVAIGDSCLFQMRDNSLITAFPLIHSDQFNSRPSLLSSNPTSNPHLAENMIYETGVVKSGDTFYLMTDALACWFLKTIEQNESPWLVLRDLETTEQVEPFPDWIANLRKDKSIRNDDVTLLRIDLF